MLFLFLTGCGQRAAERVSSQKINTGSTKIHSAPEGKVIYHYYGNGWPEKIYSINAFQQKQGYSFHYHENGTLARLSKWENDVREGRELIFFPSGQLEGIYAYQNGRLHGDVLFFDYPPSGKGGRSLVSHQIFRAGVKVYEGFYKGDEKHLNKLYPHFLEEFFFEDKYYAKVKFLLDHAGQMDVRVNNLGNPVIEYLGDNTFQLVINDALDLNGYEFELNYLSAVGDTLVSSSYSYPHIIYMTE